MKLIATKHLNVAVLVSATRVLIPRLAPTGQLLSVLEGRRPCLANTLIDQVYFNDFCDLVCVQ